MTQEAEAEAEAESVPDRTELTEPAKCAEPAQPRGLLQQMEELMAALTADLSRLDADLTGSRPAPGDSSAGTGAGAGAGSGSGAEAGTSTGAAATDTPVDGTGPA